jgi:peptidoglycan/LPS O-acetylase OafA/YrhL
MKDKKTFWALDWLRFFLAVYLVLFHTHSAYTSPDSLAASILGLGNMVTGIFFVLSGFLLTHVYLGNGEKRAFNKQSFWIARFTTLYPLQILGLVAALPFTLLQIFHHGTIFVPADVFYHAERPLDTGEIIVGITSHLLLLHAWNPLYMILDIPSWSLSALLFFYLTFPYLGPRFYKFSRPLSMLAILWMLFSLPGIAAQLFDHHSIMTDGLLHHNPIMRLPLFLAGIPLYAAYRRYSSGVPSTLGTAEKQGCMILILGTIISAIYIKQIYPGVQLHILRNGFYFPSALAIVWLAAFAKPSASLLNNQLAARLGKASLSIFILHAPVFQILLKLEQIASVLMTENLAGVHVGDVLARSRDIQPSPYFYLLDIVLIVGGSIFIQERLVTPLQMKFRDCVSKLLTTPRKRAEPAVNLKTTYHPHQNWRDDVELEDTARGAGT